MTGSTVPVPKVGAMAGAEGPLRRYRDWMIGCALPFWAAGGFDPTAGRFHERLDLAGMPIDVPHRAMVQARQVFVYARAAAIGWYPEGGALAERAAASLIRDMGRDDGDHASFAFAVGRDGRIVSDVRDAYTHAFVLLALASLYGLNGDRTLLALAGRIIGHIDRHLDDPIHGGLFDAHPADDLGKRQNPLMHLLEAYLLLARVAPDGGHLDRAGRLIALVQSRCIDAEGLLLEHFARDWAPHPDPVRAGVFEPGHHFEWVWLLADYDALSGRDTCGFRERLYRSARMHGIAPDGLIFDEVGADLRVRRRSTRLWPHTEAVKAAVAMRSVDPDASAVAEETSHLLLGHFLDRPFAGGWIDRLDEDRRPVIDHVPASSLYHLFLAASEADRPPPVSGAFVAASG